MKKLKIYSVLTALVLLAPCCLFGQTFKSRMDSAFEGQHRNGLLMGNLLVAEHGKVVYQRSFGYQDIAKQIDNAPGSAFALASVSKQFTAVAVLQLKEKGKLMLDDPFIKYLPDFPFPDITIRQLLNQTTGLPEYELFDALIAAEPKRVFTNADIIPALKVWNKGLYFKPGGNWRYSSMNYCLLALLIEKLSGQDLQSYLQRHIFKPAGMTGTYLENYLVRRVNPGRTVNYEYPNYYAPGLVNVDSIPADHQMLYNLGGFSGQGGLTSTAGDVLLFDNAFFSGKLISPASVEEALTPVILNSGKIAEASGGFSNLGASGYGMGWFIIRDTTKGKIVWHDGSRPGISTVHLHNLKTDQTVILLENTPEDGNGSAAVAYHLLNGEPFESPQVSLIQLYGQTLVKEGPDAAAAKLLFFRGNPVYKMPYDFMWLNLGYQLFNDNKYAQLSVESFRTACLLFPDAWYISQGYAAALEKAGKKQEAILMYRKCVAQNPQADYAIGRLKELGAK